MNSRTLRKRTRETEEPCRCGSFTEVIMTRLKSVKTGLAVRKVINIWCGDCKEVKV